MKIRLALLFTSLLFFVSLFSQSNSKKPQNDIKEKKKDTKGNSNKTKEKKKKAEPKKPKGPKPTTFNTTQASNVVEINRNQTNILVTPETRSILFIYSSYSNRNQEWSTVFNALSVSDDKVLKGIKFYRGYSKQMKRVVKHYQVDELPAVLLFVNDEGTVYPYDGDVSTEMLTKFIHKMVKTHIQEVKTPAELDTLKKVGSNLLLVGDANKFKKEFNMLSKYSKRYFKNAFWTKHSDFFSKFNIPQDSYDAVAYFTVNEKLNEGEKFEMSGEKVTKENIFRISEIFSRRAYALMTHNKLANLIRNKLRAVIYIHNTADDQIKGYLQELSKEYRKEYWFLHTGSERHVASEILQTLHLENDDHSSSQNYPLIAIVDNVKSNMRDLDCFVMNQNTTKTKENIQQFINDHKAGKLSRVLISEPEISEEEKKMIAKEREEHATYNDTNNFNRTKHNFIVHHSVGKTFLKDMYHHPGNDVLMYVYSDSENCLQFTRRYKRLVRKLIRNIKIKWFRINHLFNEIPLNITHIPTFIIVPDVQVNKEKKHFTFEGNFTTQNLLEFVKKHAVHPVDQLVTLENEPKTFKKEAEKKLRLISRDEDEMVDEIMSGIPSGSGFIRAVKRLEKKLDSRNKEHFEEELLDQEEDPKDFDLDEDTSYFNNHHVKDDL